MRSFKQFLESADLLSDYIKQGLQNALRGQEIDEDILRRVLPSVLSRAMPSMPAIDEYGINVGYIRRDTQGNWVEVVIETDRGGLDLTIYFNDNNQITYVDLNLPEYERIRMITRRNGRNDPVRDALDRKASDWSQSIAPL